MSTAAIFGGSFDPFTMAHRNIVEQVFRNHLADEVFVIPTIVNYHRTDKNLGLNTDDKVKVIQSLLDGVYMSDRVYIDVSELELLRCLPGNRDAFQKRRRFIDTLVEFRYKHPSYKLKFIIGTDEYKNFKNWTMWDSILQMADPIVVNGRNGEEVITDFNCDVINIDKKYANVSASAVREALKGGLSIDSYIADAMSHRTLCTTPIFRVRQVKVDGAGFDPVQVVSNDWVSIIAQTEENFVVVKQVRYGLGRPFMEFPCGIIEDGERPEVAACRELEEETGIRLTNAPNDLVYLGKVPTNPAFMTNYMHYFYVDLGTAKFDRVGQHLDDHERIVVSENDINDTFQRAYNVEHIEGEQTPALMCTALFLYENYRKHPSHYLKKVSELQ